jgi:hypothetical protein
MADQQSLFDELGVGPERPLTQQERQNTPGAPLIGALLGGVGSFFGKNKDRSLMEGINAGARDQLDAQRSIATGQSIDDIRRKRKIREELNRPTDEESTGDPVQDQMKALDRMIKVANKHGDMGLVLNANRKRLELEKTSQELREAEVGIEKAELAQRIAEETDGTGRTVILQGDDIDGAHSKAILQDDGTWTVMRPDRSVVEGIKGIELTFIDPSAKAKLRDRFFETPEGQMKNALQMNGMTGNQLVKARGFVADMAEQAGIISDMTGTMLDMYNPALALDASAQTLVTADRVARFAGNMSEVLTRPNEKNQSAWDIMWNGKKTSAAEQVARATSGDLLQEYITEQGLSLQDILPSHIVPDTREAQLFMSNVMQMAYLDARLQEPSNRGLSDTDIKNALTRIGINTADPMVFAQRQKQILKRLSGKIENVGAEFAGTTQVKKQAVIDHVYQPDNIRRIQGALVGATARVDELLGGGGIGNLANMSDEELNAAIKAAEGQ